MLAFFTTITDLDDRAFMVDLYKDYYGLVRSAICKVTRDTNHLEDLISDTFLKLIEKISVIRTLDRCRLATYVVYTSRSVCINFIKHRDVQSKHTHHGIEDDLTNEAPDPREAVEDRVVRVQSLDDLWKCILSLPERQKDLLYFKYVLELNDTEIANMLNMSPAGVRQALTRARRAAKRLIDKGEMSNYGDQKG